MANLKSTKVTGSLNVIDGLQNLIWNTIDAKAADNGVSSTQYPSINSICDKNKNIIVRQEGLITSDGRIGSFWYVRNYDTAGTMVAQKGIHLFMNKAGTLTYQFDDVANFRSALSLGNAATRTVKTASAATDTGWSTTAERTKVPDMSFMSYWNGAYSGTNSNLAYCNKGAFGNVCTLEYEQVDSW